MMHPAAPSMHVMGDIAFDTQTRVLVNLVDQSLKYLSLNESLLLQQLFDGPQTKEALIECIWGARGVVVTDASYYQLVTRLRRSFEAIGLPRDLIRTIPRYGLELARQAEREDSMVDESKATNAFHRDDEISISSQIGGEDACALDKSEPVDDRTTSGVRWRFGRRVSAWLAVAGASIVGVWAILAIWHGGHVMSPVVMPSQGEAWLSQAWRPRDPGVTRADATALEDRLHGGRHRVVHVGASPALQPDGRFLQV
ncbi:MULTISPECIES: hypothetical protein [unclassified Burkholderia]|uniref:winged helix-turn-helix domain-containing protein n=1 Tax=unclassified Burkholderia TaxID=2613784 RepID=UPI000A890597|nr:MULTISPECIES: hypothetical protein [unclassified Burkholderia]